MYSGNTLAFQAKAASSILAPCSNKRLIMTDRIQQYIRALDNIIKEAKNIKRGDSVSWNSSGGTARGKVTKIITSGQEAVPNSSFTITGTPEDPGALIRLYRPNSDGKYEATDTIVGHKTSTLRKIDPL